MCLLLMSRNLPPSWLTISLCSHGDGCVSAGLSNSCMASRLATPTLEGRAAPPTVTVYRHWLEEYSIKQWAVTRNYVCLSLVSRVLDQSSHSILQRNGQFWNSLDGGALSLQHTYLARGSTMIMKVVPLG